jgi:hypothetical protein
MEFMNFSFSNILRLLFYFEFHRNMPVIMILQPNEEQPASNKLQHSVSSRQLSYWAQYFAVLLRPYQPISRPGFIKMKHSAATMHLLIGME